jgi:hypothetical protein
MGICFRLPIHVEERVYYRYQSISFQELQDELSSGNEICFLCKERIHVYMSTTKCNRCGKMIGHSRCVSLWRMDHLYCPLCKK